MINSQFFQMYFIEADGGSDADNETNLENENEGIVQEKRLAYYGHHFYLSLLYSLCSKF